MRIEITVPRLGWTMAEGTFIAWLKKDGDTVRAGEPIYTLEGDKALQDIEATDSGTLQIPLNAPPPNSNVRVGDVLGYILSEASTPAPPAASSPSPAPTPTPQPAPVPNSPSTPSLSSFSAAPARSRAPISPRALRKADELGVDWSAIRGTGRNGRIRERDVIAAASAAPMTAPGSVPSADQPTSPSPRVPFSLAGKITLVTGAASGIGAAIATAFVEAGAIVYLADLNEAGAIAQATRLAHAAGRAIPVTLDVALRADCEALIARILKEHGRIDVLVNNAGIGHVGTILTTEPDDLQRLWSVNVQGMYLLSRAVLPSMIQRRQGSIINMASALGLTAMEDRFAYTITKHAVVGLTRSMALDFGTTQVRINCLCPGRVETPFVQARLAEYPDPEKFRVQMSASHALKRMAQPREIASAALYLASDESSFVTGSTFVIDGGYLCGK